MSQELAVLAILLTKSLEFTQAMMKAKAENRDLTAEEINDFRVSLLESDADLEESIKQAKAEGR